MIYMITIEDVCNGYIVTTDGYEGNPIVMLFEDSDKVDGNIDSTVYMLHYILENIGMTGSKHDKRRIRIVIEEQG